MTMVVMMFILIMKSPSEMSVIIDLMAGRRGVWQENGTPGYIVLLHHNILTPNLMIIIILLILLILIMITSINTIRIIIIINMPCDRSLSVACWHNFLLLLLLLWLPWPELSWVDF